MPATDSEQMIREAIVSVIAGNATVQSVAGRATDVIRQRAPSVEEDTPLPIVLYDLVSYEDWNGTGQVLLTAIEDAPSLARADAAAACRALLKAAIDALDWAAFHALGLEIVVFADSRQSNNPDVPGHINRDGQPLLQQADALVPLLYLP